MTAPVFQAFTPATLAAAVGTVAALCSMSSFVPQILKIAREHDAAAVSLKMYLVTVTGFTLWTAYGLMTRSWPVAASNAVCLVLSGVILVMKQRLSRRESNQARPAGRAPRAAD